MRLHSHHFECLRSLPFVEKAPLLVTYEYKLLGSFVCRADNPTITLFLVQVESSRMLMTAMRDHKAPANRISHEMAGWNSQASTSNDRSRRKGSSANTRRSLLVGSLAFLLLAQQTLQANNPPSQEQLRHHHHQQQHRRDNEENWYTRYAAYPPYCSTPDAMAQRKIPALLEDSRTGETRLLHATAVLRHGARTPWKAGINCWEDYTTNPETAVWDCNLTTYLSPPPPERVTEEGATSVGSDEAMFLFEKRYDALTTPQYNLSNFLQGTCQLGQLLLQGYEQEFANGQFIRDAYAYDENKYDHDERMRLLDITPEGERQNVWDGVHYRVDDEIRTLMSGQVVLRGVMGQEMDDYFKKKGYYPVIPLHTADYARDIVSPNHQVCPRLDEIRERNQQSRSFQALNQSAEAGELRKFQRNVLKIPRPEEDMDAVDCLMTTMCTDRPLPEAVNDYQAPGNRSSHEEDKGWFERLYEFEVELYVNNLKANDAEYSKLSLGPLWYEIMKNIYPYISEKESTGGKDVKLAVFAGHDTTIMPLLVALSPDLWPDNDWPTYASMVLLEIHEVNIDGTTNKQLFRSNYAFRLIYNGQVITPKIEACPDDLDLCDAEILVNLVKGFAVLDAPCQRQHEAPQEYHNTVSHAQEILSTTEGIISFLVLVLGSAAIGGATVFIYLTRGMPRSRRSRRQQVADSDVDEDGIFMTGTGNGNGVAYHDDDDNDGLL